MNQQTEVNTITGQLQRFGLVRVRVGNIKCIITEEPIFMKEKQAQTVHGNEAIDSKRGNEEDSYRGNRVKKKGSTKDKERV